jgi:hypothetical protein
MRTLARDREGTLHGMAVQVANKYPNLFQRLGTKRLGVATAARQPVENHTVLGRCHSRPRQGRH